jgi:Na+-driven multidrug efflux pump
MNIGAFEKPAEATAGIELSPQMRQLLKDPIVSTLLQMAWPNILIMLAQASTGLIETFWVARLGTDALAGMALVFPIVMMVQMMANGAIGGGISRALGSGRRGEADAFVLHAMVINVMLGLGISFVMLALGRSVYRALGGAGGELEAALIYSNVVFGGNVLLWLMSGLAAVIRGTGNMIAAAAVIRAGVIFLVPVSPLLIFGFGPIPALGIAGGGVALLLFYTAGSVAWYTLSGRNPARFRWCRLRWPLFRDKILEISTQAAHRIVASCTASTHARSYSSRLIHSSMVCGSFCPAPKVTVETPWRTIQFASRPPFAARMAGVPPMADTAATARLTTGRLSFMRNG